MPPVLHSIVFDFKKTKFFSQNFFRENASQFYQKIEDISITPQRSPNSVGRNISALVGCIKKLRALYEVQLLET